MDGRFGEAWAGDSPNGTHVNLVIGRRGSPTGAAIAAAMGAVAPGHAPVIVCLGAGNVVRPITVMRNKTTLTSDDDQLTLITWGAVQLGIGAGVLDAVHDGFFDRDALDEIALLVSVWVDPAVDEHATVRVANRQAMFHAIADALSTDRSEHVARMLELRETGTNQFYAGT
jgi:5,6,7,8-tetrahydromethanopterin hydro-lyase